MPQDSNGLQAILKVLQAAYTDAGFLSVAVADFHCRVRARSWSPAVDKQRSKPTVETGPRIFGQVFEDMLPVNSQATRSNFRGVGVEFAALALRH